MSKNSAPHNTHTQTLTIEQVIIFFLHDLNSLLQHVKMQGEQAPKKSQQAAKQGSASDQTDNEGARPRTGP